jgi:hypothetical protein
VIMYLILYKVYLVNAFALVHGKDKKEVMFIKVVN